MNLIDAVSRVTADYDWENPNEDQDPLQAVLGARALSVGEVQGWKLDPETEQAYIEVLTAGDHELTKCLREHFLPKPETEERLGRRPGESATQYTNRYFGDTRDV